MNARRGLSVSGRRLAIGRVYQRGVGWRRAARAGSLLRILWGGSGRRFSGGRPDPVPGDVGAVRARLPAPAGPRRLRRGAHARRLDAEGVQEPTLQAAQCRRALDRQSQGVPLALPALQGRRRHHLSHAHRRAAPHVQPVRRHEGLALEEALPQGLLRHAHARVPGAAGHQGDAGEAVRSRATRKAVAHARQASPHARARAGG